MMDFMTLVTSFLNRQDRQDQCVTPATVVRAAQALSHALCSRLFWLSGLWLLLGGSLHERSGIAFAFSRKQLADRQCADRHSLPRNVNCLAICLLALLALSSAAQACQRDGRLTIAWTVSLTMLK